MKNIITQFSRIFFGILFIISGLIKLNDPIGFSQLAEYFSEPVFIMPLLYLFHYHLPLFLSDSGVFRNHVAHWLQNLNLQFELLILIVLP
jgi:uncharacterized membrane protein YphA (DoxX/SURF4 family)